MKRFKLLLMILCVSMMFLGFVGCNDESSDNPLKSAGTTTSAVTTTPQQSSDIGDSNPFSVPEPATLILLGSGLVGLAGVGRKKFFKKDKD